MLGRPSGRKAPGSDPGASRKHPVRSLQNEPESTKTRQQGAKPRILQRSRQKDAQAQHVHAASRRHPAVACYHPLRAWRARNGSVKLGKEQPDSERLDLPCGGCMGCREAKAREWALRCHLELKEHKTAAFTTLTYSNEHLPPSLNKKHLQNWLKRLRDRVARSKTTEPIRFFACGEYGEQTKRPHYHAILFGLSEKDAETIQKAWPHGHAETLAANPGSINYVAGYTAKKMGDHRKGQEKRVPEGHGIERVDEETGEVYHTWQPPFIQMSRKPGIGGAARKKYRQSWRSVAVVNGNTQPVPRYLHDAWKEKATLEEIEKLENEKHELLKKIRTTDQQRKAQEAIAKAKHKQKTERRNKI